MFNEKEQELIDKAKDLEADAKSLRALANERRMSRLETEQKARDKVKNFLLDVVTASKKHGLKFESPDVKFQENPMFTFTLIDVDTRNRITVTPVAGLGFKWTDGQVNSGQNGRI